MAVGALMARWRVAAVAAAAAVLALALGVHLLARPGGHGPATALRTPAPIISVLPTPVPAPTPTPVVHDGMRIVMPEIGINLPIVEGDGYNAPLYKAAHYPGTAWPGEGGRTVIYAHARVGMFGPLFGARVGEHIRISDPDGTTWTYAITEYYSHWPVTDLRWLRPSDHEQVVLVTCTTYSYNDPRIIAVGEQVGGPTAAPAPPRRTHPAP